MKKRKFLKRYLFLNLEESNKYKELNYKKKYFTLF